MTQNFKFKSVRVTKVAFTAIASILSIALVYAQELQNPKKHNTKVYDVSFSPDGKLLASGSGDGTVKLWDAAIGKELNTLKGHSGRIYSVSFSPDGKTIASASADKTIKLWSLDGSLTKVLRGHDAEVTNVSFCPDNQVIVSSSVDNTISLWRSDGKLVKTLTVGGSIRNVDCSPDSNIIAVASDDSLKLWSRDGQELQTSNLSSLNSGIKYGASTSLVTIKDRSVISTATRGEGKGGNISINTKSLTLKDGAFISTATRGEGNGGNITITASDTGYFDEVGSNEISSNTSTAVKNDRTITALIGGDNTLKLLSKDGLLLRTLKHNKPVRTFDFHPNHKIIASGCDDGTIYIWNVNTGQLIFHLKAYEGKVSKVDYSRDGQRITSTSDDGIVKVLYPDSYTSKGVIVAFVSVFSGAMTGAMMLLSITKLRQSKRHKNTSNPQNSYIITGWVICVLPEDWRGDLEALRYELIAANKPNFFVRFITVTTLLDMLYGGIRVKLQNLYYGDDLMAVPGRRSITDSKDKSVTHNNLNE